MKKITGMFLAATILTTGMAHHAQAKSAIVPAPNLSSKTVVNQLKAGTYAVGGVKLNTLYPQAIKKLGTPLEENEYRSDDYTFINADYKTFGLSAEAEKRNIPTSKLKVDNFYFDTTARAIKLKDIQANLGKYTSTEIYDNDTKDIKDDILARSYGHLHLSLERPKGEWIVAGIILSNTVDGVIDASQLKDADIPNPMIADLKAMKTGEYQLFNVKPGLTRAQVRALIGDSSTDETYRKNGIVKRVASTYGGMMNLELSYSIPDGNILKTISFDYYDEKDVKLADVEKQLGKATTVKNSTSIEENEDGKYKVNLTTRTYGKHLTITAEQTDKHYIVRTVTYK